MEIESTDVAVYYTTAHDVGIQVEEFTIRRDRLSMFTEEIFRKGFRKEKKISHHSGIDTIHLICPPAAIVEVRCYAPTNEDLALLRWANEFSDVVGSLGMPDETLRILLKAVAIRSRTYDTDYGHAITSCKPSLKYKDLLTKKDGSLYDAHGWIAAIWDGRIDLMELGGVGVKKAQRVRDDIAAWAERVRAASDRTP